MLKRLIVSVMLITMFSISFAPYVSAEEEKDKSNVEITPNAMSAISIDASSGKILYEKNAHKRLPPASITKIMSMLLIMEAIDKGKLKLDEMVRTSEYAASMGGSQIFLEQGEEMSVEDLLKGVAMASGNDATVALAEKVAGSEELFVEMMNNKVKQLKLENTRFANTNGLPAPDHYSTAYDIAIMSKELLKYENITNYTGKYEDYLRKDEKKPFWLVNTNKLVRFYPGVDGLKTGYTSEAKFCLSATAKKDDFRVISVVLGEPNTKTRNAEVSKLFDYAFSQFESYAIYDKGDVMDSITVDKASPKTLSLVADQPYRVVIKKGTPSDEIKHALELDEIQLPLQVGQRIGKLVVTMDDEILHEFDIESSIHMKRASWWELFKRSLTKMVTL
nr:D-alanyl-D-alanine carboxypeptidase family protein [Longirhabdus pacifica]